MLLHIPQVLNPEELAVVQELMRHASWEDGRATAGSQSAQVKNNQQLAQTAPQAQQAQQIVSVALARHPQFITGSLPKSVYPPLFNRYTGQHNAFGDHIDNAVRTHARTERHVRTDISCTLFLSDPANYDGGELVVQDTFGEQRIKFAAGDAVLYPGTSVHRVEPVTRGERTACFFWIQSMVRDDAQRRLLYNMDMAILALRQQAQARHQAAIEDSDEVVKLTGCYHNLLRMWADV